MMQPRRTPQQTSRTHRLLDKGAPEPVRIRLLGGFSVSVGSRNIEEDAWRLRKAANLVKLLVLSSGHRMHREQMIDMLWPDLGRRAASNNLRGVIHAARRTLEPDPVTATRYLSVQGEQIVLCPEDQLWVDVEAFEEAAAAARRSKDPAAYRAAIELYSGELLPEDRYEEWAEDRRREFSETYSSLWLGLAWAYEEREDYGSALDAHRKVTWGEPTNEEAHAGLMRLHALSGRKADALRQYELLEEAISQGLGTAPSASTRALREEIASGRFPPEAAWSLSLPSKEVSEPPRHNLPVPRTSFVGRGRELTEIKRTLAMTRLLTLTGTGGSGKTRLALSVATDLAGAYPEGAWLVELAGLSEPELVPQAVAGLLGVREQPGRTLVESVADSLREQRALLILDNCEHLVDAAARLVDFLLASSSHLKVLATSREPLGVEGEVLFSVPPLSVPPGLPSDPGVIGSHDSVRLFLERTRMRLPDFSFTRENAAAVAEVCRKLEGIPLAIELAAARMGVLAANQVAEKLEDSLGLLSTGPRTASPRQRTMRAAIGWSHRLLSEGEKQLFAGLSTFSGGFTLEAAEAVCPGGAVEEGEVLYLVSGLVDKSLVVVETTAEARVHYRMLEPVRQYAQERLEEGGEAEAIRRRHAAFFLELAERAEPQLKGPGQVEWLKLLEEDNDNLRTAMAWLLEKGDYEAAVRMAHALWIFWMIHGHQGEGRLWIEEALAKGKMLTTHAQAKALSVQFSTYYGLGNPERMEQIAEEAAALFRQVGDKLGLAYVLACLATVKLQLGDAERAIALFEEALDLGRELGDMWGVSGGLGHLGSIYLGRGDYEQARHYFQEGLALSRQIGNNLAASTALYGLALAAQGQGDHERAAGLYTEGLKSSAESGDKANIAYCLEGLAQVASAQQETERAALLFGAAEATLEGAGGTVYPFVQDRSVHEQVVEVVRSQLDEATFSSAWAKGAAIGLGEVVEYALSGEEAAPPVSPAAQQQPSTTQQSALTRREEEIAILVARGLTNRQIASELSISEHTVATHVAKVRKKVGLSSRSQLSTWIAEQRLSTSDLG
jgi:predicted ATPase/DNA-binding SARP family transcriptional activator/DNA-binding CsgD family transcriptional regulator